MQEPTQLCPRTQRFPGTAEGTNIPERQGWKCPGQQCGGVRGSRTAREGCRGMQGGTACCHLGSCSTPTGKPLPWLPLAQSWLRTRLGRPRNLVRTFGNRAHGPSSTSGWQNLQQAWGETLSFQKHPKGNLYQTELSKNDCDKASFIFTLGCGTGSTPGTD